MSFKIKLFIFLCLNFLLGRLEAADFSSITKEDFRLVPRLEYNFYSSQEIFPPYELMEEFLKQKDVIVRIKPEDKENQEVRDNANEMLTQLLQRGFEPALEFGLYRCSTLEKKASFMVNALANQLTTVASGQLGYRIIKAASQEDPYFMVRDYQWYFSHYKEFPSQSFIYSFVKILEEDPECAALKKKLIYCLAIGYLHSALEMYPICNEDIERSGTLLLSLYPDLVRLEEFPEKSEEMSKEERSFWEHAVEERYGLNAYHLISTLLPLSDNPTSLMKEQLKKFKYYNSNVWQSNPYNSSKDKDFPLGEISLKDLPVEDVFMDYYFLHSGEFKGPNFEFK